MAILTKGQTFVNDDSVTSTKLNNLVDAAAFVAGASGTTDNTSLEVNGSGRLQVKDLGVTSAKIAASAVTTTKLPDSTLTTDGVTYAKLQRVANMKALGNVSGSLGVASEVSILDEDDMVSDSATSLATQQSIKAYVDSKPVLTIATAQASTSGTSIDFTSIPSSVKRITVMFYSVSTSGTSNLLIQIGDSGGIESTSYTSQCQYLGVLNTTSTAGFVVTASTAAADTLRGLITLCLIDTSTNSWVASSSLSGSTAGNIILGSGGKSLSSTLDRVRVTTVNGTDTFDAGSINIMYE